MEIYKQNVKVVWLKAAVLGSLWGSIEIIIGSFFHNVRLPMAGTVLAVLGVGLMISFGQMWKEKGLFWRAGMICAMMKSVSPSAILFGPMTGIFLEGLLLEFAVRMFGRNFFGYIIGGILAMYSVVFHKVTTFLIIYGFDIVRITKNLYLFTVKQLNVTDLNFFQAFFILSLFYVLLGIIASLSGLFIGKRTLNLIHNHKPLSNIELEFDRNFIVQPKMKQSLFMLFSHIMFIVSGLALMNFLSFGFSFIIILAYIIFCIYKYEGVTRHFRRISFWVQILILIVISTIFYNGFKGDNFFNEEGIKAGLKLTMRAFLVMIGFSVISIELRNPLIKAVLYKKGFWQLYQSLGLAFSALPFLMKNAANPIKILKSPIKSIIDNLLNSNLLLNEFKKNLVHRKVIIISGNRHEGKTTFAAEIIAELKNNGFQTGGFLAEGKFENNKRTEFVIKDIRTGATNVLCNKNNKNAIQKTGHFHFCKEGLEFGKKILKIENLKNCNFVIIDEIGPLEMKGKGWSEPAERLLNKTNIISVWIIRKKLVFDVIQRFGINEAVIFDIAKNKKEEVLTYLKDKL